MKRFVKFWVTSASGTVVDTLVLFLLSRYVFRTDFLVYFIAPVISFEAAMFNNYSLSYIWVWRERNTPDKYSYFNKLIKYNVTCLAAFGVKMFFLLVFKALFGWDVVICNLAALCFSFVVNYVGGDKFVFVAEKNKETTEVTEK